MAPRRMGARFPNPQLVKIHRSYTAEEVARLFSCHKNTIRSWVRHGLQPIDDRRPILFTGVELRRFLEGRRSKAKQTCPPGHMFCLGCRVPRRPGGNMAEYVPMTSTSGNLRGICEVSGSLMHRRIAYAQIPSVFPGVDVTVAQRE